MEQRPDGQPSQGHSPDGDDSPSPLPDATGAAAGSSTESTDAAVSPAEPSGDSAERTGRDVVAPSSVEAGMPQLDPEQLRQFEQFQQFREFQQFQQFQRLQQTQQQPQTQQPGQLEPLPPPQQQQYAPQQDHANLPEPATSQQLAERPQRTRPKAPRWLKWLGKKVLGWLILFVLLAIGLTWAYNHFFPGQEPETPQEQAAKGGGKYHTNPILTDQPFEAVRSVYDAVAQEDPTTGKPPIGQACGRFDERTQQQFAENTGYADCRQAVLALHDEVDDVNSYAESVYPRGYGGTEKTVRIDSCDFTIEGGPPLGVFVVSEVEMGQWLITGHEPGPKTCPAPSSGGS